MTEQATPPEPPVQRKDYDLSTKPAFSKNPPAPRSKDNNAYRSPAAMMREMGFDPTGRHMTPLQFLVAVMNDEVDMIYRDEKKRNIAKGKGGISLSYRVECAKTAAKYMHMEMPKVTITSGEEARFGDKLAESVAAGNERVRTKRIILETVERYAPDAPLAPASYPSHLTDGDDPNGIGRYDDVEGTIIDGNPEGDTDYDPDRDD